MMDIVSAISIDIIRNVVLEQLSLYEESLLQAECVAIAERIAPEAWTRLMAGPFTLVNKARLAQLEALEAGGRASA